jgi:hypothetical protein
MTVFICRTVATTTTTAFFNYLQRFPIGADSRITSTQPIEQAQMKQES